MSDEFNKSGCAPSDCASCTANCESKVDEAHHTITRTMDDDTEVCFVFDKELLYKNMVDAKADWLYELPQWDKIFTEEKKKVLYKEQKNARTINVEKKVYPNDPCPCGSGKKYKKCCGKNK